MSNFTPNDVAAMNQLGNSFNAMAGTIATVSETKEGRKWQEKMWKKQNQYAEEMYNKYNSPSAQYGALKSLGLNPVQGVSTTPVSTSSSVPQPFQSHSNYGAALLKPAEMALAERMANANISKIESETKAIDNNNKLFMATYDDAVAMTNALLKEKQISNDTASFMQSLIRDAYFNEDGTIKDNPHTLDLKSKKLQNTILGVDAHRKEYEENISNLFGVQYHTLPDDIKWGINKAFLLNLMDPVGYPIQHTQAQLAEEIDNARVQIKQKRSKEAYTFLHILDELEVGFDKLLGYLNRLSPEIKSQFLGSVLDIM